MLKLQRICETFADLELFSSKTVTTLKVIRSKISETSVVSFIDQYDLLTIHAVLVAAL